VEGTSEVMVREGSTYKHSGTASVTSSIRIKTGSRGTEGFGDLCLTSGVAVAGNQGC
jgi:hypothetical protein